MVPPITAILGLPKQAHQCLSCKIRVKVESSGLRLRSLGGVRRKRCHIGIFHGLSISILEIREGICIVKQVFIPTIPDFPKAKNSQYLQANMLVSHYVMGPVSHHLQKVISIKIRNMGMG